jgi:hypothetical protein
VLAGVTRAAAAMSKVPAAMTAATRMAIRFKLIAVSKKGFGSD